LFILHGPHVQTTHKQERILQAHQDADSIQRPCVILSSVQIGNQTWTLKNLDVSTYRNGDPIPQVQDNTAWANLSTGAWCYYLNNTANGTIYGKLYNWYAVNDPRGLAPNGYHIPTDAEWTTLTTYLGGSTLAGGKMKEAGSSHWLSPNTGATNSSGFKGLPGGFRYSPLEVLASLALTVNGGVHQRTTLITLGAASCTTVLAM